MPFNNSAPSGQAVAVTVGVAAAVGAALALGRLARPPQPPQPPQPPAAAWRPAGKLTALHCYPLKSGKAVAADTLRATNAGLCQDRSGPLRDRVFVVVNRDGRFVSARSHPRLVLVAPSVRGDALEFLSPDESSAVLVVEPAKLQDAPRRKIRVWQDTVSAVDCGDEAAAWVRRAVVEPQVHGEATAAADLRLMFYPAAETDRKLGSSNRPPDGQLGIYSDQTSYHILSKSSLEALNAKLSSPVTVQHFRPNFVIEGPEPFQEDSWSWIRIGDKAVFRVVMPCGRCSLTTVDPETGIKADSEEPLRTLKSFRRPNAEQKKEMGSDAPMLGLRLGIHTVGDVSVGDPVFVAP